MGIKLTNVLARYMQKLNLRVSEHKTWNVLTPLTSNLHKCFVLLCFSDCNRIAWTETDK